jgi:hypothetical protein
VSLRDGANGYVPGACQLGSAGSGGSGSVWTGLPTRLDCQHSSDRSQSGRSGQLHFSMWMWNDSHNAAGFKRAGHAAVISLAWVVC